MIEHFHKIEYLYGPNASVHVPNGMFRRLSRAIRNPNDGNSCRQASFAYTYLVAIGFLYKYAQYVDLDSETYIQNSDLKQLLGYNKGTKSIDRIMSKNGILERMGLVETMRDFPVRFYTDPSEKIGGLPLWEFVMMSELDERDIHYDKIKKTVKNRNYEIREPLYLTTCYKDSANGTLYDLKRTHEITVRELIAFLTDNDLNNVSFLLYSYLKSKCKGYVGDTTPITMYKMLNEVRISSNSFYDHLTLLKQKRYIRVKHGEWKFVTGDEHVEMSPNIYQWLGVTS